MRKKVYACLWAQERARKPLVADADETDLSQPQASSLVSWHQCCHVMPQLPGTHKPQCSSSRHSATQMNRDQQPQMNLDQQPQMNLDQQPQMNCDQQPQMTLDQQHKWPLTNSHRWPLTNSHKWTVTNSHKWTLTNSHKWPSPTALHLSSQPYLIIVVTVLTVRYLGMCILKKQVHFNTSLRVLPFLNWTAMLNAPSCTAVRPHWLLVTRRVTPQWSWRFAVLRSVTVVSPTSAAVHRRIQMHAAPHPLKKCRQSGCGESPTPPAAHRQIQVYNAL